MASWRRTTDTETGSAALLLAATIGALIWANVDQSSYESCWGTELSVHLGPHGLAAGLHAIVELGREFDGLELLVGQGALAFELFTGHAAPVAAMRAAAGIEALYARDREPRASPPA